MGENDYFNRPHRLWSGEALGIFPTKDAHGLFREKQSNVVEIRLGFLLDLPSQVSPIWEKYEQDELARISSIPPRNAFEEMIQWTNEGILWRFPINNEQG